MRCSNSIKPFGFNYQFARDGGAIGVILMGAIVLSGRIFEPILFTLTGLTGGAGTTISLGTVSDPLSILNAEPIASFSPNNVVTTITGIVGNNEEVIMTISGNPITSGNFSCSLLMIEFQGL